jgi:thiol oxidase
MKRKLLSQKRLYYYVVLKFLILILNFNLVKSEVIGLYDNQKDDIEILDVNNFNQVVYSGDSKQEPGEVVKASFVEFYAHWCGGCQRYARHWKEIAKETKSWHQSVIRIAAINCGDSKNDKICSQHDIQYYPTLKLFPAYAKYDTKNHDGLLVKQDKLETLVEQMIKFVESNVKKPAQWPDLEPFKSKRLDTLFVNKYKQTLFGLLIFENETSQIGRQLLLDFASFNDRVLIRRITPDSNPTLVNKFGIDTNRLPVIYLVNNTKETTMKPYELFDQKLINRYQTEYLKISNKNQPISEEEDVKENDNDRVRLGKMIHSFINYANLITKEESTQIKENSKASEKFELEVKNNEAQPYLANMDERVYLEDLETALHFMLRSDVAKVSLITGSKMISLKEWIKVLLKVFFFSIIIKNFCLSAFLFFKYFPARRPIRNFLVNLYSKLNSTNQMTGAHWKSLVNDNKQDSDLPSSERFVNCKGSKPIFRGYPCTLWTLFHVLTVRQYELEMAKPEPCKYLFDFKLN